MTRKAIDATIQPRTTGLVVRLDDQILQRLTPGGLLAITLQSEVGVGPGEFRAPPGELKEAFGQLELIDEDEADGTAWLLGRRPKQSLTDRSR